MLVSLSKLGVVFGGSPGVGKGVLSGLGVWGDAALSIDFPMKSKLCKGAKFGELLGYNNPFPALPTANLSLGTLVFGLTIRAIDPNEALEDERSSTKGMFVFSKPTVPAGLVRYTS